MSTYILTPTARASLADIYAYTFGESGQAQADKYLDGFYEQFASIAAKECVWRPIPPEYDIKGYFIRYERHFIYWRVGETGNLIITAINHVRMLQSERLRAAFGDASENDSST